MNAARTYGVFGILQVFEKGCFRHVVRSPVPALAHVYGPCAHFAGCSLIPAIEKSTQELRLNWLARAD